MRFIRRIKEIFRPVRHIDIDGELSFETRFVARKISKDGTESIRIKESTGRAVDADIDDTGAVAIEIQGQSPQGEEGALAACQILVEHLNTGAATWGELIRDHQPERGVDCVAKDGDEELLIQVTRIPDPAFWRELADRMHLTRTSSTDKSALDLYSAIRKKQSIAPSSRECIVLAVDAMDTPAHATRPVVTILRNKYGHEIDALGFRSVWVVGPVEGACIRLDRAESAP